jgi:hypothetical protein
VQPRESKEAARGCGGRAVLWGFNRFLPEKPCPTGALANDIIDFHYVAVLATVVRGVVKCRRGFECMTGPRGGPEVGFEKISRNPFLDPVADAPMKCHPLFARFEVTPRRHKIHRPADRDRECLFC